MFCKKTPTIIVLILFLAFLTLLTWPTLLRSQEYEAYFNYIEMMPVDAQTSYSHEAQGITHDENNWFISQNAPWIIGPMLWKIPKNLNLADTFDCGQFGVECVRVWLTGELSKYDHVGDIDYYHYQPDNIGFVLVPLEQSDKEIPPAIAAFNAANLQYVAYAELTAPQELAQPRNAPWVAVDPHGFVYITHDGAQGAVWKYQTNWRELARDEVMSLQYVGKLDFVDKGTPFGVGGQGAVFSKSGKLLYTANGAVSYDRDRDGISVFDIETQQRIDHSSVDPSQPFWYPADWGECEPEGLTIWDLDEDNESSHTGQLHVMLLNNDVLTDNIYVFHYTNKIYVDCQYSGEEKGTATRPFSTIAKSYNIAWDGVQINIRTGSYSESLVVSKRIRLVADGGTVVIGQ